MKAKDSAYCGYNVGEAEQYGLIKAIILNQIRWYLRTLGKQFDGQKCWRTVKDLADDIGIPYDTVRKNLPTEEMGIKYYPGYKPGTMTRTTWWEECPRNGQIATSEMTAEVTSKEMTAEVTSYNKEEKKKKSVAEVGYRPLQPTPPFSPCSQDGEAVVDLKAVKKASKPAVDGKTVYALLEASGKKGAVTASLIRLVRVQANKFGLETLFEVAKKSKFDKFYAEMGLQTLLAEKNIENILNQENKAEDSHPKSTYTGIRREI